MEAGHLEVTGFTSSIRWVSLIIAISLIPTSAITTPWANGQIGQNIASRQLESLLNNCTLIQVFTALGYFAHFAHLPFRQEQKGVPRGAMEPTSCLLTGRCRFAKGFRYLGLKLACQREPQTVRVQPWGLGPAYNHVEIQEVTVWLICDRFRMGFTEKISDY